MSAPFDREWRYSCAECGFSQTVLEGMGCIERGPPAVCPVCRILVSTFSISGPGHGADRLRCPSCESAFLPRIAERLPCPNCWSPMDREGVIDDDGG